MWHRTRSMKDTEQRTLYGFYLIFNPSHLLTVFSNGQCPRPRLVQVGNFIVISKTSGPVTTLSTNNSWPITLTNTLQDTSRILCCSRTVNLMYQRISGHNRIFQVYPRNTISCLSSLHFGFNKENLLNKVHVDFMTRSQIFEFLTL